MYMLYTLSVFVHILAASAWIGSMIFFAAAVVPVVRRPEYANVFTDLVRRLGGRFRIVGWASLVVLVVTGACSLGLRGIGLGQLASAGFWSAGFGQTLAYKLTAVLLVLLATAAHDVLSARRNHASSRRLASLLGRLTLVLSVVVLLLAVWLVRGMPA